MRRRILITGTSGGIGGAVQRAAEAAGWEVVALNRADFAALDAAPLGETPFDAVVFATGTCPVTPLAQLTDAALAETLTANCALFVRLMRRIVRERRHAPGGLRAVAVSSVSAVEGWPGGVAYCASKGALSAACRALDAELAPRGIRVTAVEPRYVLTDMFRRCAGRMGVPASAARDPDDFARELLSMVEPRETEEER